MSDTPLKTVQIVWNLDNEELAEAMPPAKLVTMGSKDDPRYFSSWGACNDYFNEATDEERVNLLMRQFVHMTVADGVDPGALHEVLLDIPEYRKALADFGTIEPEHEED